MCFKGDGTIPSFKAILNSSAIALPKNSIGVQVVVYCALILGLLPYGAVHELTKLIASLVTSLACFFSLFIPIQKRHIQRLELSTWVVLVLLVAFALAQSATFENNPLAHPFWKTAGDLIGFTHGAISVEPSLTRFSLFSLIPPFLLFVSILHAFQGTEETWKLVRFLGIMSLAFIVYGLAQATLFPNYVLIRELDVAKREFTSTLINRNHAATIAGLSSLVCLALATHSAKGIPFLSFPKAAFLPSRLSMTRRVKILIWSFGLFLSFIALFMTQSRGGLAATVLAWGFLVPPLLARAVSLSTQDHAKFGTSRRQKLKRVLLTLLTLLVAGGFIGLYAEGTLFRLADTNMEAARFCNLPAMWQIFLDNWLLGTGFGTFEVIFPVYRDPSCGVTGIWTQAHNFWLEGLMGFGVLFAPIAIYCIWRLVHCFWVGIRTRRSQRFASYIGISAIILLFSHGLVDFSLQIPGVAYFGSAMIAAFCIISLQRVDQTGRR